MRPSLIIYHHETPLLIPLSQLSMLRCWQQRMNFILNLHIHAKGIENHFFYAYSMLLQGNAENMFRQTIGFNAKKHYLVMLQ